MQKKIICLAGPTASGKTDLALALAQSYPLTLISVDSAAVYQGFDIGTGKPPAVLQERYPHHLIDICHPRETYSAARFCRDVQELITKSFIEQRYPVLVGGTMLYFQALLAGLAELPPADAALRAKLHALQQREGLAHLYEWLISLDSALEKKIHPNDQQRIVRGLEICLLTGRPWSQHETPSPCLPFETINFMLWPTDRQNLHRRIMTRFDAMLQAGWVEETAALVAKYNLDLTYPSLRMVGYRQMYGYLKGAYRYECMRDQGLAATRQLAKRQITWMRKLNNFKALAAEDAPEKNVALIAKSLI